MVVTRRIVRGKEILEKLGRFDVGQFYGGHAGRDGLETVGRRVEQVGSGVLDIGEPSSCRFAQLYNRVCLGE